MKENNACPLSFLLGVFNELHEENRYLCFELGFTRQTDWMVHIIDNTGGEMKTVVLAQHAEMNQACLNAISEINDIFDVNYVLWGRCEICGGPIFGVQDYYEDSEGVMWHKHCGNALGD